MATELFNMTITEESIKHYNFRKVLIDDFKSLNGYVPIQGGWGYTIDDAIIIDKNDPIVDDGIPFDGVGLEYMLVGKRIYEELIIFQKQGEKYEHISWDLQFQKLLKNDNRQIDHLNFKVTCYKDGSLELLRNDFIKTIDDTYTIEQHEQYKDSIQYFYYTDYYFDITSFYGQ